MNKKRSNTGCLNVLISGVAIIFIILAIMSLFDSSDSNNTSETTSYSSSITTKYSQVSLNVRKKPNVNSSVLKVLKQMKK